jgi:Holliday junction DNA helicase RuvA
VIAKLTGVLDSIGEDQAVVDVGGVGYLAYCSGRTLRALPAVGGTVSLAIETHVREDHIHLYGFIDAAERDWFGLLITVQGVGARVALAILTVLGPDAIADAVIAQDKAAFTQAAGVGPKLAARLVAELKDRVGALVVVRPTQFAADSAGDRAGDGPVGDAISALVNLGYRRTEAYGAVSQAARRHGADAAIETLITAGLKELGG